MSRPAGSSETTLMTLWRSCVLAEWGERCAFKGLIDTAGEGYGECRGKVECHHVKRRGIAPLRYSPSNGVPLCQEHHKKIGLRYYRKAIEELLGPDKMEWLDSLERKLMPDYLRELGLTKWEWLKQQKDYLTSLRASYLRK